MKTVISVNPMSILQSRISVTIITVSPSCKPTAALFIPNSCHSNKAILSTKGIQQQSAYQPISSLQRWSCFYTFNCSIIHSYCHQDRSYTVPQNAVTSNISLKVLNHHKLTRNNEVVQHYFDQSESVNTFIDNLIDGQETKLASYLLENVNLNFSLQQELESRSLPPVQLITFNKDYTHWLKFIKNLKHQVYSKPNTNIQMERLLSILKGEAKKCFQLLLIAFLFRFHLIILPPS